MSAVANDNPYKLRQIGYLWRQQDKWQDAYVFPAQVYAWFTESFDAVTC